MGIINMFSRGKRVPQVLQLLATLQHMLARHVTVCCTLCFCFIHARVSEPQGYR
jgi:hypothetical protein